MKILSIFVIIAVLLSTIIASAIRPGVHKQFILTPPDFKISGLSQRPTDLQSVRMFKIGDAPVQIVDLPNVSNSQSVETSDAPIIPSDVKIIPSDFIQNMPVNNGNSQSNPDSQANSQSQVLDNSDKVLEQVEKMLNTEILPSPEEPVSNNSSSQTRTEKPKVDKNTDSSSGCSICDQLKNPKVRAELIAWNKWRSDLQNTIMEHSDVEAPYGTLFYFTFKVDNNRHISNIRIISTRPNTEEDIKNIRSTIVGLNGDNILTFPKGSNRKSITFSGGFLMSDYEMFSSPSDFKDFEYVQY